MTKYIILFNGPPGSGKDAIASEFQLQYPERTHICKFADNIRQTIFAIFPHVNKDNYDELKNKPLGGIYGQDITLRQFIIKYAEQFMKPQFGKDIFGMITCQNIHNILRNDKEKKFIMVTDLGHQSELESVIQSFPNENIKIILIKLTREGCNFEGDSRYYIDVKQLNEDDRKRIILYDLHNTSEMKLEYLAEDIMYFISDLNL